MFYEHLKVKSDMMGFRMFSPLPFGPKVALSVQAHRGVYCKPRETLEDLTQYTAWELALLRGGLIHPSKVPGLGFKEEWLSCWEDQVAPYVPTPVVQEIYEHLCDLFGMSGPQEFIPVPHHRFTYRPEPKDYEITTTINTNLFRKRDE